ncbi:MAG: hypothetical protein HY860_00400, partial [Chlamydiales bacterium]|nr:hypothetical protein [Chlamydiales bacterium]
MQNSEKPQRKYTMTHKLFILPNLLSQTSSIFRYLPKEISDIVTSLVGIVGESKKETIQYLKKLGVDVHKINILLLNEHTTPDELKALLETIKTTPGNWGLVSDAGMPIIADPGAKVINFAKKHHMKIDILPGPSSVLFALIQSGLSGQAFTFHGYFPYEEQQLKTLARQIIAQVHAGYTQLFIETP